MGKDIVLHVSATNPAAFLYLKFGFKIEEIVNNFYENYQQTEDSQHALYLRLARWIVKKGIFQTFEYISFFWTILVP